MTIHTKKKKKKTAPHPPAMPINYGENPSNYQVNYHHGEALDRICRRHQAKRAPAGKRGATSACGDG